MASMTLRPEIKAFCDAAETLVSPILLRTPLTEEERGMIRLYMQTLEEKLLNVNAEAIAQRSTDLKSDGRSQSV